MVVHVARLLEHCALEELVDVLDPIVSAAAKLSRDAWRWVNLRLLADFAGFWNGFCPKKYMASTELGTS